MDIVYKSTSLSISALVQRTEQSTGYAGQRPRIYLSFVVQVPFLHKTLSELTLLLCVCPTPKGKPMVLRGPRQQVLLEGSIGLVRCGVMILCAGVSTLGPQLDTPSNISFIRVRKTDPAHCKRSNGVFSNTTCTPRHSIPHIYRASIRNPKA